MNWLQKSLKGQMAKIKNVSQVVKVMNPEGIHNSNNYFHYCDMCDIGLGGVITVVGEDKETDQVLVRYVSPVSNPRYSACPTDTLFFMDKDQFLRLPRIDLELLARIKYLISHENDELDTTRLDKKPPKPSLKGMFACISASIRWVTVLNPEGINNLNSYCAFCDTCVLDEQGTVTVVGEDLKTKELLVRYVPADKESAAGTACAEGTLFFMSRGEFMSNFPQPKPNAPVDYTLLPTVNRLLDEEHGNT